MTLIDSLREHEHIEWSACVKTRLKELEAEEEE